MKSNGLVSGKVGCFRVGMFIQQLFIGVGWDLIVLIWGMLIDPACPGRSLQFNERAAASFFYFQTY